MSKLVKEMEARAPAAVLLRGGVVSGRQWQWYGQLVLQWVPYHSTGGRVPVNMVTENNGTASVT